MPFIEVPSRIVEGFGKGRRPPLVVTVNGYTWRGRVAVYGGRCYLGLTKATKAAGRIELGDRVRVEVALDDAPREVVLPTQLAVALAADQRARANFDRLSYTTRNEYAASVASAKRDATRKRRLETIMDSLQERD